MPKNYWNPNYWGIGSIFTQSANIGFSMMVDSRPTLLAIKDLVKTQPFSVKQSDYVDGVITSVIEFERIP